MIIFLLITILVILIGGLWLIFKCFTCIEDQLTDLRQQNRRTS